MQKSKRYDPVPVREPYHGIYSNGVESRAHARHMFVSGQVGVSSDGQVVSGFYSQCEQAIDNLLLVLQSADMQATDIIKMTFFLMRREDMNALLEVRKAKLDGVRPAITTVFVAGLVGGDWLVEVEAIAARDEGRYDIFKEGGW